jgi:hypothetical protein
MHSWKRVFTAFTLLAALGAAACQSQAPNGPGGGGGPSPAPTASPRDPGTLTFDAGPAPFADPTSPEERASTRYSSGTWVVSDGAYAQTQTAPSQTLMIQRYTGNALGKPNGDAPSHYRAEAVVQVYEATTTDPADMVGAPNGVWGFIPYYQDAQHFVLMMATGREAMVWVVDGLRPGDTWDAATYRKWHLYLPQELKVGDSVTWGAEVNAATNEITITYNGDRKTAFRHPMITDSATHSVALVSNGNKVRYDTVTLEPLSQD